MDDDTTIRRLAPTRASTALLFSVVIDAPPPASHWIPGPAIFRSRPGVGITHDSSARRTYLEHGPAGILFGTVDHPTRWHREPLADGGFGELTERQEVDAVEILLLPRWLAPGGGVAVLHVSLSGDPVAALEKMTTVPAEASRLRSSLNRQLTPCARIAEGRQRAYSVSFVTFPQPPPQRMSASYNRWAPDRQWLWGLASATTEETYPPDPEDDLLFSNIISLSADWRGLVLRDGAAFVGLRPHDPNRPTFLDLAELHVHTLYADVIALGFLQRQVLHAYANRLAVELQRGFDATRLSLAEHEFVRVRTTLWWEKTTTRGVGNALIRAFQRENRLAELLTEVRDDLSDSARLVQTESAGRQEVALGALTILGLPFGLVFAIGAMLGEGPLITFVCLGVSVVAVAALHAAQGVRDLTRDLLTQVSGTRSGADDGLWTDS